MLFSVQGFTTFGLKEIKHFQQAKIRRQNASRRVKE